MEPDILTTAEILDLFSPLKELDKGLGEMLSEYQAEQRRTEGEELKQYCLPGFMLNLSTPYGYIRYEFPEDIERQMRSIRLERELIDCKPTNMLIAYWSGDPKLDIYGKGFHPWLNEDPVLRQYPETLASCYERVLSAYYQCMGIEDRWSVWNFYRTSIFRQAGVRTPAHSSDLEKWEEMQRQYFDSQKARRQFLENMYVAIEQHAEDANDFNDEEEDVPSENLSLDADSHGFVYFIRNGDLCKIGITENLLRRMDQLKPDEVLNVVRCKNFRDVEKDLHSLFKEVRLPQTEYFRLSEEQISKAHKLMTSWADF